MSSDKTRDIEKLGCEDGGPVHSFNGSTNEVQVLSIGDELGQGAPYRANTTIRCGRHRLLTSSSKTVIDTDSFLTPKKKSLRYRSESENG